MEIKYKLYPYPVLSSYSNDYGNGAFDVAIDIVRDGYDLRIDFLATLTCQSLQDCIKQGVAKYVYHLECAQTGFRTVVQEVERCTITLLQLPEKQRWRDSRHSKRAKIFMISILSLKRPIATQIVHKTRFICV